MAWARISGGTLAASTGAAGTAWNAGNLGAALSANDRIIASVSSRAGVTIAGIADSLGNTWVQLGTNAYHGGTLRHSLWTAVSGAGTPSSITITPSATTDVMGIAAAAYSGLDTSGTPLDLTLLWAETLLSGTADSGTTGGTTSAANLLKIGAYSDRGGNFTPVAGTLDTTYTMDATNNPNANLGTALESADSGASGSTARATMTSGDTTSNGMYVAVFKLAAGGAAVTYPQLERFGSRGIERGIARGVR